MSSPRSWQVGVAEGRALALAFALAQRRGPRPRCPRRRGGSRAGGAAVLVGLAAGGRLEPPPSARSDAWGAPWSASGGWGGLLGRSGGCTGRVGVPAVLPGPERDEPLFGTLSPETLAGRVGSTAVRSVGPEQAPVGVVREATTHGSSPDFTVLTSAHEEPVLRCAYVSAIPSEPGTTLSSDLPARSGRRLLPPPPSPFAVDHHTRIPGPSTVRRTPGPTPGPPARPSQRRLRRPGRPANEAGRSPDDADRVRAVAESRNLP